MIITFVHSTLPKQFGKILKNNVKITIIDQNSSQLNGNLIPQKIYKESYWMYRHDVLCRCCLHQTSIVYGKSVNSI